MLRQRWISLCRTKRCYEKLSYPILRCYVRPSHHSISQRHGKHCACASITVRQCGQLRHAYSMQQFERTSCAAGRQMRLVVLLQAQASWEYPGVEMRAHWRTSYAQCMERRTVECEDCCASIRGNAREAVNCAAVGITDRALFRAAGPAARGSPYLQVTKFDLWLP